MTEVLARISARRPWVTIGIWVLFVVIGLGLSGTFLGSATTTDFRLGGSYESERAAAILEDKLRGPEKLAEIVIVHSATLTVDDAVFRAKVEALHEEITALGTGTISGGIDDQPLSHYYQAIDAGPLIAPEALVQLLPLLVSADRSAVLMHYTLTGTSQEATANVVDVIHVVEEASEADDFVVLIGGDASTAFENNELAEEDLQKGERFGVPVALLVLLVLFGAVVATLLPLGLAAVSIVIALAAVAVIGQQFQLVFFVTIMVVMLGLAVGIDYSLLIVSRFKEEMRHGMSTGDAVAKTGGTAGRTVLFSGATVVLALVGLLIVPASFYQSLALGAILVVIASLAATLTLLPAVLALLGPRIDLLTIPFLTRFSLKGADTSQGGFWDKITLMVTKRPVISLLIVGVPMLALSYFYLEIRTGLNDVNTFPDKAETKKAFLLMEEKFSFGTVSPAGFLSPAEIVVSGNIDDPQVMAAIGRVQQSLVEDTT
ncbi:MAG: MMPL family transporter, partial [Chloroflexi bacterium]|nr:MMPL family transporter [Chloroflexota bacterium]